MHRILCYDVDEEKKKYIDLDGTLPKITLDTKLDEYLVTQCRCALKSKTAIKMPEEARTKYLRVKA